MFFSIILVSALFGARPGHSASPPKPLVATTVHWTCPYTMLPGQTHELPQFTDFEVTWDPRTSKFEMPMLKSLLDISSASKIDYFDCFQELRIEAAASIYAACAKKFPRFGGSVARESDPCGANLDEGIEKFRDTLSAQPRKQSSVPRILPNEQLAGSVRPDISKFYGDKFTEYVDGLLKTPRAYNCNWASDPALSHRDRELFTSREFLDDYLPKIMKGLDEQGVKQPELKGNVAYCKHAFAENYIDYLASQQKPEKQCPQSTPECKLLRQRSTDVIRRLREQYGQRNSDALAVYDQVISCLYSGDDPSRGLRELSQKFDKAEKCIQPVPGEPARDINEYFGGHLAKYSIGRKLPEVPASYVLGLNVSFVPAAKAQAMKQAIEPCLKHAGELFTQPNGEKLEIQFVDSPERIKHEVNLSNPKREDAFHWADITGRKDFAKNLAAGKDTEREICATDIHEMMHLAGLVDEYEEKTIGYTTDKNSGAVSKVDELKGCGGDDKKNHKCGIAYDCRVKGPYDSLMSHHVDAFKRAEKSKPKGGLLYPAEWRLLTQPGCVSANATAYSCMELAYRTSADHAGPGCPKRPKECVEPSKGNKLGWLE